MTCGVRLHTEAAARFAALQSPAFASNASAAGTSDASHLGGARASLADELGRAALVAGGESKLADFTGAAFVLVLLIATGLWYAAHVYLNCAPRVRFFNEDAAAFHNFRSSSRLGVEPANWCSALTLRFARAEDEQHFATGNAEALCQRMCYLCWALSAYAAVVSVLSIAQKEAALNPAADQEAGGCHTRLVPICAGLTVFGLLALMLTMAARAPFKTSPYLEHFLTCWLALVLAALLLFHLRCREVEPHASETQFVYFCDMNFAYVTIALTQYIFVFTPLRLIFFSQLCGVAVVFYIGQELLLSVPDEDRRLQAHLTLVLLFSVLFSIVGKRHIEYQQRMAWTLVYQSARILNDSSVEDDSDLEPGGSMIHKTHLALSKLSQVLEAISISSDLVSPRLQKNIRAAKSHAEFAKEAFQLGDSLFKMTAKQALTGTEYEDNADLVDFVKAAMVDPWHLHASTLEELPAPRSPHLQRKTYPDFSRSPTQAVLGSTSVPVMGVDVLAADLGEKFSFSALDLARHTNNLSLIYAGERVMVGHGFCEELGIEVSSFRAWAREIHLRYQDIPYHSEAHGAQVCALTAWLARRTGWLGRADVEQSSALFLAALAHDVGHTGRNNLFCTKSGHPIALLWNDSSVLENMHAATCFAAMRGEADMLEGLDARARGVVRTCIIRFILATDIKEHHSSLARLQARIEGGGFLSSRRRLSSQPQEDKSDLFVEDVLLAGETLMKAGDIGHGLLPWKPHREWSYRVAAEFFEQGDEERALGLPISPLCDRTATTNFTISQEFFIEAFSSALFRVILAFTDASGVKDLEECLESGQQNKSMWQIEASAGNIDPADLSRDRLLELFGRPKGEAVFPYEYDRMELEGRAKVTTEENLLQLAAQGQQQQQQQQQHSGDGQDPAQSTSLMRSQRSASS